MKSKIYLKILLIIVILVLLIKLCVVMFVEPWVGKKTVAILNGKNSDYFVEIEKVHISLISRGLKLEDIKLTSKQEAGVIGDVKGEILSIEIRGINLAKALFRQEIDISEITISNSIIKGVIPSSPEAKPPIVSPISIQVGEIFFDKINIELKDTAAQTSFSVQEGILKMYDLQIAEQDSLTSEFVKQIDFEAKELEWVTADSMNSISVNGIDYSATSNILAVDSISIHPNYTNYDFTSRYKFQKDRVEAVFRDIYIHDFVAAGYFKNRRLVSSWIEIGKMDMEVFRDNRKEFKHEIKPVFMDLIYNYPGSIHIDSIGLTDGNVKYTEHAKEANETGRISFDEMHAKCYNLTNDTIYKTESASFELKADALLMGKGRIDILLKAKLFDSQNTFSVNGTLKELEANELNPILENSAFIYVSSGKIESMDFSFNANNDKATGQLTLLYHGFDIAVKNRRTDDTTALKEQVISLIINKKVIDSNPKPGDEVREGVIDYERDPEKFIFNYCFKSILSGIKSSLIKNPK